MSVIVIAETPGLDAEGYQRIATEQGHGAGKLPQVFPLHYALTRSEA
jgi:hypothetical protein